MKIIVGLGNPGKKFAETRHNTGFLVVEQLKNKFPISNFQFPNKSQITNFKFQKKLQAEICQVNDILLAKPQTFMNDSGMAVAKIKQFYKVVSKNIWVIHDDLDINSGEYKVQFGRGAAGHKGVASVIRELGTQDFWRVRIGIGPNDKPSEEYVLEEFGKEEKKILDKVIEKVIKDLISRLGKNHD